MGLRKTLVVAATIAVAAGACTQTVDGSATRDAAGPAGRDYGYADDRCGLLSDDTVQQLLAGTDVDRVYNGAVCQYIVDRGGAVVDTTFAWFETGTLARERAVAAERGGQPTDTVVVRREAIVVRTAGTACAVTAATDPGVASWWVQFRGGGSGDPCADAERLLTATLSTEM
ncbi:DUF3558 domain-containing protein [Mycobacterium sp. MYCO198283]|uniref:DUF3558 domain-containing protein n=1 Tax=Mycobacterium sp. MYCO198283 TaxID=2883505 RepID=UPI001E40296C|nr:DUF3558 domain-containing protein [Mycobacterium sp. MYCO198283]MCG5431896.1 DUF3558 domain-containing protein [Mycobacterium sp. MYCO198283]